MIESTPNLTAPPSPFASGLVPLLRIDDVLRLTGLSRSTVYRLVREGTFPAPLKLSVQSVAWRADALQAWMEARPQAIGGAGR